MKIDTAPANVTDFLLACVLLTRLPLPHLPEAAFDKGARAVWAYPLAGALVGALGAVAMVVALALGLAEGLSAGIVLATLVVCTGAMHEDGLADVADGFWGGSDAAHRLAIMKDSQIGTYGTLALIIVTGLRWLAYTALLAQGSAVVIAVAAMSRGILPSVMYALPLARKTGLSHSVGRPRIENAAVSLALGTTIALLLLGTQALTALLVMIAMGFVLAALARRKIGGQTGDVLGAVQQLSELAALLVLVMAMT